MRSSKRTKSNGVGGDQVEGRQAVRELLLAGRRRVREILVSAEVDEADILDEIIELADEAHVPIKQIGRGRLDAMARTDAPQGIIARAGRDPAGRARGPCRSHVTGSRRSCWRSTG